ncbi:MAG: RluA family pseudouridine synthase [Chloroflexi bacterium]|nr:RluA family pseudouridine synthase [Chloroflexota bacterium]
MSSQQYDFIFEAQLSQRLDKFLVHCLPAFSRSRFKALIEAGHVIVNGKIPHKAGFALVAGDEVTINIPPVSDGKLIPEKLPLEIIFESDDVLVINKEAGMVVHPSAGHPHGTLANAVLAHDPNLEGIGGEKRPGIVHRLDKDTSGVVILAKNDRAFRWLQDQFKDRQVGKIYLALVDGAPPTPKGRVDAPIGRDLGTRQRMAVTRPGKGRNAISEYFTVDTFEKHTLLRVRILTGRTHQIRLHLAFLNCPVVGDLLYGHRNITIPSLKRQFLHAKQLSIILPGEASPRTFEAQLPKDLERALLAIK